MKLYIKDVLVRAWQRGYSPQEIVPCLQLHYGNGWYEVDIDHAAYPRAGRHPERANPVALSDYLKQAMPAFDIEYAPKQPPAAGPGTELSKLLKRFGIEPTPTCQCRAKAAEMDAWGPDECERPERIEEVLGVMREEAKARGLPFLDVAGRLLVRRAIANARRAAS